MEIYENIKNKRISMTGSFSVGNASVTIQIVTRKPARGGLVTTATCGRIKGNMFCHLMFQDFSKTIIIEPEARATEKALRLQHAQAVRMAPSIVDEAKAFYAAKSGN